MVMKKLVIFTILSCLSINSVLAQQTKKDKQEARFISVGNSCLESKQYSIAKNYYTKAISKNPKMLKLM